MLRFKPAVRMSKLHPAMAPAMYVCDQEYERMGVECWITSCEDGKHRDGSFHYIGMAFDVRTWNLDGSLRISLAGDDDIDEAKHKLAARIDEKLPADFRCIYEPTKTDSEGEVIRTEHLHVEYRGGG